MRIPAISIPSGSCVPRSERALLLASCLTLVLPVSAPARGEVYRWVDKDGITVYSQLPPANAPAETLTPDPGPSPEETARAIERLSQQAEREMDAEEDERQAAEKAQQEQEALDRRQATCASARSNLETLRTLGARRIRTPDGELRRLSDEERAARIAEAERQIAESCN